MTGLEIYQRTAAYDRDARTIRLLAPEWKLLLAFDGQRGLSDIAKATGTDLALATSMTGKFLDHGWIAEQPITLEQYLQRTGAATPSAPPVFSELNQDKTPVSLADGNPLPQGHLRLGSVVDFIISLAPEPGLGHFTVYRVFLRIPHDLLQAEDLASIHLVNETIVVRTPALKEAIATAVEAIVGRPLPASVYAD